MTLATYVIAVLALLLAPGPTNILFMVAGAEGGARRVWSLLPSEVLGYLAAIIPLSFMGATLLAERPWAGLAVKVSAAAWVISLAVRLWQTSALPGGVRHVTQRQVFITTLLNPKALVFGLVLLPSPLAAGFTSRLALFCVMVVACAVVWGSGGNLLHVPGSADAGGGRLRVVQRVASVWLAMVSVTLLVGALRT